MSEQGVGPQHRGEFENLTGQLQNGLPYTPQKGSSAAFKPALANWRTRNADTDQFAAQGEDLV